MSPTHIVKFVQDKLLLFTIDHMICMLLYNNHLRTRSHVVKHVYSYCTGELVGLMVYYRIHCNIVTSKIIQPSKYINLFDRFISLCTVCLV